MFRGFESRDRVGAKWMAMGEGSRFAEDWPTSLLHVQGRKVLSIGEVGN